MNPSDITPMGSRLLVRPLRADELATEIGSIILPPDAEDRQRYRQWVVVAAGPDVTDERLLPGARVMVNRQSGVPLEIDDQPHLIVFEEYVSAIFIDG